MARVAGSASGVARTKGASAGARRLRIPGSSAAHDATVNAIADLLHLWRVPVFRINQTPTLTSAGWRNRGADPGCPDIVAVLPGTGRACGIEVKSSKAMALRYVQQQARFAWVEAGGLWITARTVGDVIEAVDGECHHGSVGPGSPPARGPVLKGRI